MFVVSDSVSTDRGGLGWRKMIDARAHSVSLLPRNSAAGFHAGGIVLVEAAGQWFHLFRDGLDYAFILNNQDAGRVIREFHSLLREGEKFSNPSAGSGDASAGL